jgi:cytosine/adenosine deaminase-related metal-dependent hydrolase
MLVLRNAAVWQEDGRVRDVWIDGGRVVDEPKRPSHTVDVDLEGRALLPALVNAHDHLDFSTFPPLGSPPYGSVYEWARDVDAGAGDPRVAEALAVPLVDRLFLGGVRNLIAGAAAVLHHNPFHRSLARRDFPVRVQPRYGFAHSPGLTPDLKRTYRTSDRRIPWLVHAGEGTDAAARGELSSLVNANVLRQNTVIIHAVGFNCEDARVIAAARASVVWCPESNRRLYGAVAPVAVFRAASVHMGLGSDSPVSGVRDPLSNLAAARAERVLDDHELVTLATAGSAEVARLPAGGARSGETADLVSVDSVDALLEGDRRALALVLVGGQVRYGDAALLRAVGVRSTSLVADDGRMMALALPAGARAMALWKRYPALRRSSWARDIQWVDGP